MDNNTKQEFNELRKDLNILELSDQAIASIMMALQNSLLNQTDIVPTLKGMKLVHHPTQGLIVTNPPIIRSDNPTEKQSFETSVQ